jgi:hypothetical protein
MNKFKLILGSAFLLTITAFGASGVLAQDSEEVDSERRAAFEERRQERRVEVEARREERWTEFSEDNPELAEEIEALRAERAAQREQAQAEFTEQYPNIAAALEDGRLNRGMLADRPGPERGRGFNRGRRGPGRD